jgi:hypothetical protein
VVSKIFSTPSLTDLFAFPFKEPDWVKKSLIGAGLVFLSFFTFAIPLIFVLGYCHRIMHRVIVERSEPYLPEWNEWGKLFIDGLRLVGVSLVLMLPVILFFIVALAILILTPLFASSMHSGSLSSLLILGILLLWMLSFGLAFILSLAISAILPPVYGHIVARDSFQAAFQVREWWQIFRDNLGSFLLSYLATILLGIVASVPATILGITIIFSWLVPFVYGITMFYIPDYPLYPVCPSLPREHAARFFHPVISIKPHATSWQL